MISIQELQQGFRQYQKKYQNSYVFEKTIQNEYRYWFLSEERITPELLDRAYGFRRPDTPKRMAENDDRTRKNFKVRIQIKDGQLYLLPPEILFERAEFWAQMLLLLQKLVDLPDMDLVINLLDEPCVQKYSCLPVFSICRTSAHEDLLLPNFFDRDTCIDSYGWGEKENRCVWRGSTSGGENFYGCFRRFPRSVLVKQGEKNKPYLDLGFTKYVQCDTHTIADIERTFPLKQFISQKDQFRYKYVVQVDGNITAWRYKTLLVSNSVVFKQESPYYEYYYAHLKPYEHYIPIGPYCEDIGGKVEWAMENDEECRNAAENATAFAASYLNFADHLYYLWRTLTVYSRLLTTPIIPHPRAQLVDGRR